MQTKTNALTLKTFLEFVEIRTKVASVFPLLIGILWSVYHYQSFSLFNSLLFTLGTLSFDMCTTAINNAVDFHKAVDMEYKHTDNVIGKYQLNLKQIVRLIFFLLGFAMLMSLILVWQTDIVLFPMGMLCFLIGIGYTFGPVPLSRLPFGEFFSGVTMGFGIFFLAIYVQNPSHFLASHWTWQGLTICLAWPELLLILVMSLPLVFLIANIMLANNICDLEQDIRNHRHTLVFFIGKKYALRLYSCLAILPWAIWLTAILVGQLPLVAMLGFLVMPLSIKCLLVFQNEQVKSRTFIEAIKSFLLFSGMYLVVLIIVTILG